MYRETPLRVSLLRQLRARQGIDRSLLISLLLIATIAAGATLRFTDLAGESYWIDEVAMIERAGGSVGSIVDEATAGGGRPPLFTLIAHVWVRAFGTSEVATRSLSALASSAALVVMFAVASDLFGSRVGLLSTLLMAVSEFQIAHAQNFRYYGLFVLLTLLSFWLLLRALRSGAAADLGLYAAVGALMCYTHQYGLFVLAAQNAYILLSWPALRALLRRWFLAQAAIGIALLPILILPLRRAAQGPLGPEWIPDPQPWFPLRTMYKFLFPSLSRPTVALAAAVGCLIVGVALVALRSRRRWLAELHGLAPAAHELWVNRRPELLLTGCWLVVPIALPYLVAKYLDRYLIAAAPALYILMALALLLAARVVPLRVSLAAMAVLVAPGLYGYYVTDVYEQWREVAMYVEQKGHPTDVIVFAPGENGSLQRTFSWYYPGELPRCDIAKAEADSGAIEPALARCTAGHHRFWVVLRGQPEYIAPFTDYFVPPRHPDLRRLDARHFREIDLYLFERAAP